MTTNEYQAATAPKRLFYRVFRNPFVMFGVGPAILFVFDRTGLGLGLALSRAGIEANSGRIYARNGLDTGCVFTVELPRLQFSRSPR